MTHKIRFATYLKFDVRLLFKAHVTYTKKSRILLLILFITIIISKSTFFIKSLLEMLSWIFHWLYVSKFNVINTRKSVTGALN